MIIRNYEFKLKRNQRLYLVPIGDIHFGSRDHDAARFKRFVDWAVGRKERGDLIRLIGMGDYCEAPSPSERAALTAAKNGYGLHETTLADVDEMYEGKYRQFLKVAKPIHGDFLGLLAGHHCYNFTKPSRLSGMNSDQFLAREMECVYFGTLAYLTLRFPQADTTIKIWAQHGFGSSRTDGAKLSKRQRVSSGFRANIILMGHDDSKFSYANQVIDVKDGRLVHEKVYYIGTGSFQKGYEEEQPFGGYAEQMAFNPHDLGVASLEFELEKRDGETYLHWRSSV